MKLEVISRKQICWGRVEVSPHIDSPNLGSGWGLFLSVCQHCCWPNYVCPISRHALNSCMYVYCEMSARSKAADGYIQWWCNAKAAPPLAKHPCIQPAQAIDPVKLCCFKDREQLWVRQQTHSCGT